MAQQRSTFYGAEQKEMRAAVQVALEYWLSNAIHRDRDDFSRKLVLPWAIKQFPSLCEAQHVLDLGSSHGISAAAVASLLPSITQINSVDNAPGAVALGNYFVGNENDVAGYSPDEFDEVLGESDALVNTTGKSISELLQNTRKRWVTDCDGKVNFILQNIGELARHGSHQFVYNAMGWHWAVKSRNADEIFERIKDNMDDGALFVTYTFGLADEHTMRNHPDAEKYLTLSPVLRNFYAELERETKLDGLQLLLSEPGSPIFKTTEGHSGLQSDFEEKLTDVKFDVFKYEASPELLATMARITTPNHLSLFALREGSDFFTGFQEYAQKEGKSSEEAVRHLVQKVYATYVEQGGLQKAIEEHHRKGPFFELLPTVGGIVRK